jgi:unspecific monooxygenase
MSGCPFHSKGRIDSGDFDARRDLSLGRLAISLVTARFHFIRALQRLFRSTGCATLRVPVARTDLYLSADPRLCREVIADRAAEYGKTAWEHRVLRPAMEDGLILLEGKAWKTRRQASASCFGGSHMERLAAVLSESAAARLERWPAAASDLPFGHEVSCILDEAVLRFFLDDYRLSESYPGGADRFSREFKRVEHGLERRAFDVFSLQEALRSLLRPAAGLRSIVSHVTQVIGDRVDRPIRGKSETSVLRILLEHIGSSRSVTNEIRTMLSASATSAHLLTWIGHLLAADPERQLRLRKEIVACGLGRPGVPLSLTRIEALPYLNAVIQEGLRLYPPAPYLVRRRPRRHRGERSSLMLFSLWAMQRDPARWQHPDEFWPERWEQPQSIPEGAFVPFGLGPRVCVGKHFAMTEVRVILIELLRRYELSLPTHSRQPVPVFTVLTRPRAEVRLHVKPIARPH